MEGDVERSRVAWVSEPTMNKWEMKRKLRIKMRVDRAAKEKQGKRSQSMEPLKLDLHSFFHALSHNGIATRRMVEGSCR